METSESTTNKINVDGGIQAFAYFGLIITCAIWGFAFVAQRTAMTHTTPFLFNGYRFLVGSIVLILLTAIRFRRAPCFSYSHGIWLGTLLFLGISAQQIGLVTTTAGKAGFITGFYLILVPLQLAFLSRRAVSKDIWIGASVALAGLALLCLTNDLTLTRGDTAVFICTFIFAQHIIAVDRAVPHGNAFDLAFSQYLVCSLLSIVTGSLTESSTWISGLYAWRELFYSGVISVGIGYTLQVVAQQYISPSHAAIIFSLESVFAAFAGWLILNEVLSVQQVVGGGLVIIGCLIARPRGGV